MNAFAIMELIGVVAGIAALACFLFGDRHRLSVFQQVLLTLVFVLFIANSITDTYEQAVVGGVRDVLEDYLDLLLLLAIGTFVFSFAPQSVADRTRKEDASRVFTRQLFVVLGALVLLNLTIGLFTYQQTHKTLAELDASQGEAVAAVIQLRGDTNNAIQEAFAYVVSGETVEKEEYEAWASSFAAQAKAYCMIGRLDKPEQIDQKNCIDAIVGAQNKLHESSRRMFADYEANGRVSSQSFHEFEQFVDDVNAQFGRLQDIEFERDATARATATEMLRNAEFELPVLRFCSVLLQAGLFGLLIWQFQRYTREQLVARQEKEEAEESLRQRDQAIQSANSPIAFSDLDGRITSANHAFAKLFGFESTKQVIGLFNTSLASEPVSVAEVNATIIESGEYRGELKSKRINGEDIHIDLVATLFKDSSGRPLGFMATFTDISERKRIEQAKLEAEEQLRELEGQLNHASRLSVMGEMVAGIAHEINQPLFSIRNFAIAGGKALQQGDDNLPMALEFVDEIENQSQRASEIMKRLSDFVRNSKPRRETVDVDQLLDDGIALSKFESGRLNVTISREFEQPCRKILADEIQMQQVLVNILRNGCEALQSNEADNRRLTVSTSYRDHEMEIAISDNGPGFSKQVEKSLFETFYSTKEQGMGMGLAIARSIIQEHGGSLRAFRNKDGGATFSIILPIQGEPSHAAESGSLHR